VHCEEKSFLKSSTFLVKGSVMSAFVYSFSRRYMRFSAVLLSILALSATVSAATLSVGPGKQYAEPCAAIIAAAYGDTIEIDAVGNYAGKSCYINKNQLTIRGVNGRPKINAAGMNILWYVEADRTVIENVEIFGAAYHAIHMGTHHFDMTIRGVYLHNNGAAIFIDPLMIGREDESKIVIENSEFGDNGGGGNADVTVNEGYNLIFQGNYSHDPNQMHLDSWANKNTILYNRFTKSNGRNSPWPEIRLFNLGNAYVIGNVIQMPAGKGDSTMLSYGLHAAGWDTSANLYVVNNTFLNDDSSGGNFIRIHAGHNAALVQNNMFIGTGTAIHQSGGPSAIDKNNYKGLIAPVVDRANFDLHPVGPVVVNAGSFPGHSLSGFDLTPLVQYKHVAGLELRPYTGALSIGAYEPLGQALNRPDSMLDDSKWTQCASEGGTCNIPMPGTARRVRFGANNLYSIKTVASATNCNIVSFGDDPTPNVFKSCSYENTPIDLVAGAASVVWATCAQEGGSCTFSGGHQVRYGANDKFRYRPSGLIADSFPCNVNLFGDPVPNVRKHCDYDVLKATSYTGFSSAISP
jgi:hypothetical protein